VRQNSSADTTGTFQFVVVEIEFLEFGAIFPNRIRDLTCQKKKDFEQWRQCSMMDHALTREFVVLEIKMRQIDTITQ
jgi:hypothetical protein